MARKPKRSHRAYKEGAQMLRLPATYIGEISEKPQCYVVTANGGLEAGGGGVGGGAVG